MRNKSFWKWADECANEEAIADTYKSEAELKLADIKPNPPVKPSFYAIPVWMNGYWKCDFKTPVTPVMCVGGGWMSV